MEKRDRGVSEIFDGLGRAAAKQLLGTALKSIRKEKGWTWSFVATKTGLSVSCLCNYEHNHRLLSFENLCKLSECLDIAPDELLDKVEEIEKKGGEK